MLEIARLVAIYDADTRPFDQKTEDIQFTLNQLSKGDVFKGFVGGQLFMQAVNALQQMSIAGVQAYASFERLGMTLQTLSAREIQARDSSVSMSQALEMSKGAAQETLNWITQLAIKSPFTQEGVALAYRQAMAYGFTGEQAQRLTQAMIDFAAGSGAAEGTMSQVALALGQIQARGKLAGQEVLQLVNAGIPVQSILAKAFGKSTAEIMKMTEQGLIPANAAIEAIVQALERDFGGAAERQSETITGLLSSLKDLQDIKLREFFAGFFEEVQPLLKEFVETLQSPESSAALKELGKSAGETIRTLVEGGKEVLEIWQKTPDWLKASLIGMAGIEAMTPLFTRGIANVALTVMNLGTQIQALPRFMKEVTVAQDLLRSGSNVFDVMSLGASGLTAAIGPLAIAFASLTAVVLTYQNTVAKANRQGIESVSSALRQNFEGIVQSGGRTNELLAAFSDHVDTITNTLQNSNPVARVFVDQTKLMAAAVEELNHQLVQSASSYTEYLEGIQKAAETAGMAIDKDGNLIRTVQTHGRTITQVVQANFAFSESQYNAARASEEMARAVQEENKSLIDLNQAAMSSKDILGILQDAFKTNKTDADTAKQMYQAVAIALGETSERAIQVSDDLALLSEALALGVINQRWYVEWAQQAKEGTLELSASVREQLQSMVETARVTQEAGQAASEAAQQYWSLAESLKGASQAEYAKTILGGLNELLKNGEIDVSTYSAAFETVGKQFGFVNDKSIALAGSVQWLLTAVQSGIIAPQQLGEAIRTVFQDAADGSINWDNLMQKFATSQESIRPVTQEINNLNTEIAGIQTRVEETHTGLAAKMPEWVNIAQKTVQDIQNAFSKPDWVKVGMAVSDGIASGIEAGSRKIIEAARSAAMKAYEAAIEALDIHSPSRKGMFIGQMFIEGQISGLQNAAAELQNIARLTTLEVVNSSRGAIQNSGKEMVSGGMVIQNLQLTFRDTSLTPETFSNALQQLEWMYT